MPQTNERTPAGLEENRLELAFARLPRPQKVLDLSRPLVPTKSLLMQAEVQARAKPLPPPPPPPPPSLFAPPSPVISSAVNVAATSLAVPKEPLVYASVSLQDDPGDTITLGKFAQDGVEWLVRARRGLSSLFMVKKLGVAAGLREKDILRQISHANVAKLTHAFYEGDRVCIGLEYCRFTLGEILHVHLKLEVPQVQHIAHSIINALGYLGNHGIAHHRVGLKSIRISIPDLRIVLSDFERATQHEVEFYSNPDLVDLGLVLLECMEGRSQPADKRKLQYVKDQRAVNKVFGLSKPERWGACKELIDFLDDLFNEGRPASAKILKKHRFISSSREDGECMRPYIELVTLECFTFWVAGE